MSTKDRILDEALKLMNAKGMEQISTHEIARALDIRQSNITYYFATKAEIVRALAKRMIEEVNTAVFGTPLSPETFSFTTLYNVIDNAMKVHQKYAFILMNYAPIITADKELNDHFVEVLKTRKGELDGILTMLDANGYIKGKEIFSQSGTLMLVQNILAIYWIQEAAIYMNSRSDKAKRKHYLKLHFQVYIPYATAKGKKELEELFS